MVLKDGKTLGHYLEYFVRYGTFPPIKIGNSVDQFAFAYRLNRRQKIANHCVTFPAGSLTAGCRHAIHDVIYLLHPQIPLLDARILEISRTYVELEPILFQIPFPLQRASVGVKFDWQHSLI